MNSIATSPAFAGSHGCQAVEECEAGTRRSPSRRHGCEAVGLHQIRIFSGGVWIINPGFLLREIPAAFEIYSGAQLSEAETL